MRSTPTPTENYLSSLIPVESKLAIKAKAEAERLNKAGISISPYEANLIGFFIRRFQCAHFVELGTLTGYSGLKILENLPSNGHLWTFELNPQNAAIAEQIFDDGGYGGRYSIFVGKAEEQLAQLAPHLPIDGVFIDANKSSYPFYLEWARHSLKKGGLLIADNTLLRGVVPDEANQETVVSKIIQSLRNFNEQLSKDSTFDSILLPTKEGLTIAIKG